MKALSSINSRSGLNPFAVATPLLIASFLAVATNHFLDVSNLANLAPQLAPLAVVTLGQLIVALGRGIDLSVGSTVSLTTCVISATGGSASGLAIALLLGLAIGVANGAAVAYGNIHPIISTLATMTFVQGLALFWLPSAGGQTPEAIVALSNGTIAGVPGLLVLSVVCFFMVAAMLRFTRLGLRIYAVGSNPLNAYFNGVSDKLVIVSTYVLCSLLAVAAGVILAGRIGAGDPLVGSQFALNSITALALGGVQFSGGIGGVLGALTGVLTIGFIRNGMNLLGVDAFVQSATTGLLLLLAISFQRRNTVGF